MCAWERELIMDESTIPAELQEIHKRLSAGDHRMGVMEGQLAENTIVTMEIRDILSAAKVGFRVIGGIGSAAKWIGAVAIAIGAVWGLVWGMLHGVPPK
jgi:hypothetical protein